MGFRVSGFGFRVSGFGFRVSGLESRVSGSGFWVSDFGFRVSGVYRPCFSEAADSRGSPLEAFQRRAPASATSFRGERIDFW